MDEREADNSMARRWRISRIGGMTLLAALAACGRSDNAPAGEGTHPVRLTFEDRPEPDVFSLDGLAVRDDPKGSAGLWAAVVGLKRPERALVINTGTGRKTVVALFTARAGSGPTIRLSNEAADAIGVGDSPVQVRITALRREPLVGTTKGRF